MTVRETLDYVASFRAHWNRKTESDLLAPIVVPIVVGAVSVAQERNWGLAESQLTLPIPARKQWLVKVSVAILTTLLLGSVVPAGIGFTLQWLFGQESPQLSGVFAWLGWYGVDPDQIPSAFLWSEAVLLQLLLLALAIYASLVSQTALRAAVSAIGIAVAYLGCLAGSPFLAGFLLHINPGLVADAPNEGIGLSPASLANAPAGLALLFVFLLVLVQIGVVLRLGFANFRRSDWRVCHVTIHALVVVVVIFLGTLISRSLLRGI